MAFTKVTVGQPLESQQTTALQLVSRLQGGRDVVLAIDLTESVGINNEGRLRLRQIIEDSLKPGDSVYVVPFASDIVPLVGASEQYPLGTPIQFDRKSQENIEKVLQKVPFSADLRLQNTDIQRAELTIYEGLAQINQNRLQQQQPIKPQSVVWVTDAPLFLKAEEAWTETPVNSAFRVADSPETKQRQAWIDALLMNERSLSINNYKLTVVDITPTVQEFCTPAPSGQVVCKVDSYIFGQLWLPASLLGVGVLALLVVLWYWSSLLRRWRITAFIESKDEERECSPLLPGKSIAIGEADSSCVDFIECPGSEPRGYLERKGNKLYLKPTNLAPIEWNGREIDKPTCLTSNSIRLNCPDGRNRDFYIDIKVKK